MFAKHIRKLFSSFQTKQQIRFLDSLDRMQYNSDEQLITNVRSIYSNRQFLEECQPVQNAINNIENYLLKSPKCSVAYLQCYYKLKEMRLVSIPFRHNLHRKYYDYVLDINKNIKNQHVQKYLWFLYDEGCFERQMFADAAQVHTLKLHQIYEYMSTLQDLPTWQPYIRVFTMLKQLGHDVKGHQCVGSRKNVDRINHNYYPYLSTMFSQQQMSTITKKNQYDEPFLMMLCNEYFIRNNSRYDSYLQRVEQIEIQKQYQRFIQVMVWSDLPTFLDLMQENYKLNGGSEDIQNNFSEMFFRLCEIQDIDLETSTRILDKFLKHPNFMYTRRYPIITRCTDSIFNKNIDQFSYFPTDGYLSLLSLTKRLVIDQESKDYLQQFICQKITNKLIWNPGQLTRMRQKIVKEQYSGGFDLAQYLSKKEEEQ